MHVWADDAERFPFAHPCQPDFRALPCKGTLEMLLEDMDSSGVTGCVLVQVIFHGWDNRYIAECVRRHPRLLKAHALIDPTET
jgi:predicted TIM-barrel fold metal-dependent hydrolase